MGSPFYAKEARLSEGIPKHETVLNPIHRDILAEALQQRLPAYHFQADKGQKEVPPVYIIFGKAFRLTVDDLHHFRHFDFVVAEG